MLLLLCRSRLDGRTIHSIDGENVARGVLGFFELIFFAVSVLLQKRVICRPPENNFNQQLVQTQTTISNDPIQIIEPHHSDREQQPKNMLLPVWLRSVSYGASNRMRCPLVSAYTRPFWLSRDVWESARGVVRNVFLYGRFPTEHERPAFKSSKPFTVGFLGALNGSDTSRTQVALAEYVNCSWSACERKAKSFQQCRQKVPMQGNRAL